MTLAQLLGHLRAEAETRGEPMADTVRHYLLHGIVHRIAAVPLARVMFVLRGGLLTRAWLTGHANRTTRDLDLVGDFAFDRAICRDRFDRALAHALPDCIAIDRRGVRDQIIWGHTEFPGVRFTVAVGLGDEADQEVTVDVGFHDPLVPAAIEDGDATGMRVIRPETQVAWKLHALAEMRASFRPKDVADLLAIARHVPLVDRDLAPAIDAAFTSRKFAIADARATLDAAHWATKPSRLRWEPYRKTFGELAPAVAAIAQRLGPALDALESLA